MSIPEVYKLVSAGHFNWRTFFLGIFMALDSYSPLAADLAGWADPTRKNTPEEEENIRKLERDLLP